MTVYAGSDYHRNNAALSANGVASIDNDFLPAYVSRIIGGEKQRRLGHVGRTPQLARQVAHQASEPAEDTLLAEERILFVVEAIRETQVSLAER